MSNDPCAYASTSGPKHYRIRIQGHLGPDWADWFESMTIQPRGNGETTLTGPVVDQAALHGLLRTVRDLGLTLIAVTQVTPDRCDKTNGDDAPTTDSIREESDDET